MEDLSKKKSASPSVIPQILSLYLSPFLVWYLFTTPQSIEEKSSFAIGIIAIGLCGIVLFLALKKYEMDIKRIYTPLISQGGIKEEEKLSYPIEMPQEQALPNQEQEIVSLEEMKKCLQERDIIKERLQAEEKICSSLKEKERLYEEYKEQLFQVALEKTKLQEEISSKNGEIDKIKQALQKSCDLTAHKEEQIAALKSEISSLHFEIKTLTKLEHTQSLTPFGRVSLSKEKGEAPLSAYTKEKPVDALDRALNIALTLAEESQLKGKAGRLFDFSIDALAMETRRLSDALHTHATLPLFAFCKKEKKLLFATGPIQRMVGLSQKKIEDDFFSLLTEGEKDLRNALSTLHPFEAKKVSIEFRASGREKKCSLLLGLCPLPPFTNCILAVLTDSLE